MNTCIIKLFPTSDRGMTLVFSPLLRYQYHHYRIPGTTLSGGVKYTGVGKICDFQPKSSFIPHVTLC